MSNGCGTNLNWRPSGDWARLRQRAQALAQIRAFFAERAILEVETPSLVSCSALEAEIEQFTVPLSPTRSYWLIPSPEFHMKRLLAAGSGPIYQVCKAFRKGEQGEKHNPEFTLLEYYRPGFTDLNLMTEIEELLTHLTGSPCNPRSIRYGELFQERLQVDAWSLERDHFVALCGQYALSPPMSLLQESARIQEWRDFLFSFIIEPQLGNDRPLWVTHYPQETASLARLDPESPQLARRFELYINGLELCNGFWELTDLKEQKERFQRIKEEKGRNEEMDPAFLAALAAGLPPSAGVAVGLERLFCALWGGQLKDWISFHWLRA